MGNPNRLIVITGVTRGLGLAMAEGFAALGHTVIGCGRSPWPRPEAAKRRGRIDFSALDLASDPEVAAWARGTLQKHGVPDLLLNNAAVINRNARLWEISAQEFSELIDINIKGVVNVIRHFVPPMVKEKRGVIINFSSGWGRSTSPEVAPYCASKWAIEGLTQALAQELPAGMAAVALNPGVINTQMLQSCFGKGALSYPLPTSWARNAVPYILQIGAKDNGSSLTVPGVPIG